VNPAGAWQDGAIGERAAKLINPDWAVINEKREEWTKRWNRESSAERIATADISMAHLELDRVSKQFGAQTVVDDFSLAVGRGSLSPSSAPLAAADHDLADDAGFLDPSRGVIRLEGKD